MKEDLLVSKTPVLACPCWPLALPVEAVDLSLQQHAKRQAIGASVHCNTEMPSARLSAWTRRSDQVVNGNILTPQQRSQKAGLPYLSLYWMHWPCVHYLKNSNSPSTIQLVREMRKSCAQIIFLHFYSTYKYTQIHKYTGRPCQN